MKKSILAFLILCVAVAVYALGDSPIGGGGGGSGNATSITDNLIVNADVNSAANIDGSKMLNNSILGPKINDDTTISIHGLELEHYLDFYEVNTGFTTWRGSIVGVSSAGFEIVTDDSVPLNLRSDNAVVIEGDGPGRTTSVTVRGSLTVEIDDNVTISPTELSYLDNATGPIQAQIDLKAPLASPVFTGSVAIPQGASPTVDAAGEIAVDTTAGQLLYYDNNVHVLVDDYSKSVTILSPNAYDNSTLIYTKRPITVTQLDSVITGADNVTWFIRHAASRAEAAPDNVVTGGTTTTSSTTGTLVTSFDDATIPAGRWVWLQCTALGGTPISIHVTMYYTFDRE